MIAIIGAIMASFMASFMASIMASFVVDLGLRRTRMEHRWHIKSSLAFIVAYGIWNLTNAGRFSGPNAWFQGHAVWHVLSSVSLGCMAILYRSEIETSVRVTESAKRRALSKQSSTPPEIPDVTTC